jgi:hypothetical protein
VHEISAGVLTQIGSCATTNREMLRSQNRQGEITADIARFFLKIRCHCWIIFLGRRKTGKCFACSESRKIRKKEFFLL